MKIILITGSNGFLGSHLIDWCLNKSNMVYGIDRPLASFKNLVHYTNGESDSHKFSKKKFCNEKILIETNNKNLKFLECDITNAILLEQIILKIKPDYIFHFGAQPYIIPSWEDPANTIEVNVIGTVNVFEPIKKHNLKTRVIVACSATEFGTTATIGRPLKESDPLLALHPYGISKIAAELLSRQYYLNFGIQSINLRFFNLTGTRRTNDAPSDFIRRITQIELGLKEPWIEVGNLAPYRDFLDVTDAVNAIWLAATEGSPGETYHVCSGKKIQIKELLNNSISLSSKKIEVKENVHTILRSSDEDMIIGDHSKITDELSWNPIKTLQDTLKEMFQYWLKVYEKS
ncbi:MAG: GDP-mannose 4,6-dehydratase [Promethearchaeota archaeon]